MKETYLTELHLHTKESSSCSNIPAREMIEAYKEKGYSTIVITDHCSKGKMERLGNISWKQKIDYVFTGFDIAKEYVETNLDFDTIKDYIPYAVEFDIDNLKTDTLPGVSEQSLNGTWIYSHYEDETQEVLQELFGEESESQTEDGNTDIDRANVEIEILNGSGENEKLTELIGKLEEKGYSVTKTGNTSSTNTTTIINRSGVNEAIQSEIKEIVGKDNFVEGEEGTVDITIILGNDN